MNLHSRDRILLEAHGRNKKAVDHVLGPQMQVHDCARQEQSSRLKEYRPVPRNRLDRCLEDCLRPAGKFLRVCSTKNSVGSGIAEIPLELRSRHFNLYLPCLLLHWHYA